MNKARENLIPTFEIGERVIFHCRAIEWRCPNCGEGYSGPKEGDFPAIIVRYYEVGRCLFCGKSVAVGEGWIEIKTKESRVLAPYTLLERIVREDD